MNHQSSRRDVLLTEQALGEGGDTGDFDEQADKGFEGSQDGQGIVGVMALSAYLVEA